MQFDAGSRSSVYLIPNPATSSQSIKSLVNGVPEMPLEFCALFQFCRHPNPLHLYTDIWNQDKLLLLRLLSPAA